MLGTAKFFTTLLMRAHTDHGNVVKVAVGYVRVSTLEQASEGVSLDAQRDNLRAYCKFNSIKLIDITADEGVSGGTLDRPGLQEALRMLKRGRANTLIVMKLDRLTRSVRDLCALVDDYFIHDRYHLLSVCGMVNTHNAAGRMLMLNLANFAQFQRERRRLIALTPRLQQSQEAVAVGLQHVLLALVLCGSAEPADWTQADQLATSLLLNRGGHVMLIIMAQCIKARLALLRGQLGDAIAPARAAMQFLPLLPLHVSEAAAVHIRALLGQGSHDDALSTAEQVLATISGLGCIGFAEVEFRLAASEAFYAVHNLDRAHLEMRETLRQIQLRADDITNPFWKNSYLTRNPYCARTQALAKDWGLDDIVK